MILLLSLMDQVSSGMLALLELFLTGEVPSPFHFKGLRTWEVL